MASLRVESYRKNQAAEEAGEKYNEPCFLANVAAPRLGNAVKELIELWKAKTKLADDASFEAAKDLHRAMSDPIWCVATGEEANAVDVQRADLPYVDAFIEESLRLGQPLPFIGRETVRDTVLLGSVIPKGNILFCLQCGPSFVQPAIDVDEASRGAGTRGSKDKTGVWKKDDIGEFEIER